MGSFFAKAFTKIPGNKEIRILLLNLDNAGKTTMIEQLKRSKMCNWILTQKSEIKMWPHFVLRIST